MTTRWPPVPFDSAIAARVEEVSSAMPPIVDIEGVVAARQSQSRDVPVTAGAAAGRPVTVEEHTVPGPAGQPEVPVTVIRPVGATVPLPLLYNMHGGGMIVGNRHLDAARLIDLVERFHIAAVNVGYRLAPEFPFPAGVEDCFAGLVWSVNNAADLGFDPARVVVMGGSAGGGLAAAVTLMARDRGGPTLAGQLLLCPMIDNTATTVSSHQYAGLGTCTREENDFCWTSLLGDENPFGKDVSAYAAPSRASDLARLPPAFIEVGSAELFRDEDVAYARRIWAAGGNAELHVWSGGCHGFDIYLPDAAITRAALAARDNWLTRVLRCSPRSMRLLE